MFRASGDHDVNYPKCAAGRVKRNVLRRPDLGRKRLFGWATRLSADQFVSFCTAILLAESQAAQYIEGLPVSLLIHRLAPHVWMMCSGKTDKNEIAPAAPETLQVVLSDNTREFYAAPEFKKSFFNQPVGWDFAERGFSAQ